MLSIADLICLSIVMIVSLWIVLNLCLILWQDLLLLGIDVQIIPFKYNYF